MTLLHFLAQVVEDKHPDIMGFIDEITHTDRAARGKPGCVIISVCVCVDDTAALPGPGGGGQTP